MKEILDAIKYEQESRKAAASLAIVKRTALEQGEAHLVETIESFMPDWWRASEGSATSNVIANLRWATEESATFIGYSIETDLFERRAVARYTVKKHTRAGSNDIGRYDDAIAATVCLIKHLLSHATAHWINTLEGMNCKEELKS